MRWARRPARSRPLLVAAALVLAGCGGAGAAPEADATGGGSGTDRAIARADAVADAVGRWRDARSLAQARAAAEDARNLVTGPGVRGAGDADGDGRVERPDAGLLPGEDGTPGIAQGAAGDCAGRHVLGGPWTDPTARWDELFTRVDRWAPGNNRFPELPSHAQRVVGWADLALAAADADEARGYAGHAALHAGIVADALRADAGGAACPPG